jgi:hypothetical protein
LPLISTVGAFEGTSRRQGLLVSDLDSHRQFDAAPDLPPFPRQESKVTGAAYLCRESGYGRQKDRQTVILKARPMTTFAWTFIDHIDNATVWQTGSSNPDIWDVGSDWDVDARFFAPKLDERDEIQVIVIDCVMDSLPNKRVVIPAGGFGYLMNDHGKTIERL